MEGVNCVTKHLRVGQNTSVPPSGGIEVVEAPVHISNVAVVDPETKKPTRVGYRFETVEKNGETKTVKVRLRQGLRKGAVMTEVQTADTTAAPKVDPAPEARSTARRSRLPCSPSSTTATSCRSPAWSRSS